MFKGKVVWFDSARGYGFVRKESDGIEYFTHYSHIIADGYKKLDAGDIVEFDVDEGPNGKPQAVNVVVRQKAVA
jgi:cold shock protein